MRPLLKFIRVCSQHDAAPEVKPAVNAYRDLGTLGKGGWGRKSRLIDWYTAGLPDGRGHGRITQKRQYKNQSGRGKLPAVKVAVSDKTIFL